MHPGSIFSNRHFTGFVAIVCFLGTAAAAQAQQLWTDRYVSRAKCASHAGAVGPERHSKAIQGHKWPHPKGSGLEFIDHNARGINAIAMGRGNTSAMRARLLNAAGTGAFTRLDFEGRGGSSPSFVSAIVVESVSYSVAQLRSSGAVSAEDVKAIDQWVQRLLKNSSKRAGSPDHKAAIATAHLLWGAAIADKRQFSKGYRQFKRVLRPLRSRPYFSNKVRVNNEVMHQVVHGAVVLRRNGVDLFNARNGKHTLHEAVAFHAQSVRSAGTSKLRTSSGADDHARSIMRANGWGTHLAWIPLYLSHYPAAGAAGEVRALNAALRRIDRKPYYGRQIGIHSDCLYGRD